MGDGSRQILLAGTRRYSARGVGDSGEGPRTRAQPGGVGRWGGGLDLGQPSCCPRPRAPARAPAHGRAPGVLEHSTPLPAQSSCSPCTAPGPREGGVRGGREPPKPLPSVPHTAGFCLPPLPPDGATSGHVPQTSGHCPDFETFYPTQQNSSVRRAQEWVSLPGSPPDPARPRGAHSPPALPLRASPPCLWAPRPPN